MKGAGGVNACADRLREILRAGRLIEMALGQGNPPDNNGRRRDGGQF